MVAKSIALFVLAALLEARADAICFVAKSSEYQVRVALETTNEENIASIRDSVAAAKAAGREVMVDCEHFFDGYKENPQFALACAKAAYDAGARWVVLCDTNGGTMPHEIETIVGEVAKAIPGDHLGIHTHNDTEQAVEHALDEINRLDALEWNRAALVIDDTLLDAKLTVRDLVGVAAPGEQAVRSASPDQQCPGQDDDEQVPGHARTLGERRHSQRKDSGDDEIPSDPDSDEQCGERMQSARLRHPPRPRPARRSGHAGRRRYRPRAPGSHDCRPPWRLRHRQGRSDGRSALGACQRAGRASLG